MITRVIYPPLKDAFFNAIAVSNEEIILAAPYVQMWPVQMIIDILKRTGNIDKVNVHLITNVSSSVFLTNSSDINAILKIMEEVPNINVTGIGNLHAKIYIFDSKRFIITSGNLSLNGMSNNLEMGAEVIDVFEATELRHKMLDYAKEGTTYLRKDILDIKQSLEKHAADHVGMIEHLQTQSANLNRQVKKVTSKRVAVKSTLITNPEITAIISVKGTSNIPQDIDQANPRKFDDSLKAARKISTEKLKKKENWDPLYQVLVAYHEAHPKYWPIKGETFEHISIGDWCEHQRLLYRNQQLDQQHQKLLTSVGFEFDSKRNVWEYCVRLLEDYREEYPNQWPNTREAYNGQPLGRWCLLIRGHHKKGNLTPEQVKQLNDIGFEWDDVVAYWKPSIELLKAYRQEYPNQWPQISEPYNGYNLFSWCMHTSKHASSLSDSQRHDLRNLGFPYDDFYKENIDMQRRFDKIAGPKGKLHIARHERPVSPMKDTSDRRAHYRRIRILEKAEKRAKK